MENKTSKVYTKQAITIATFFGGPLAAGLLMAKNYKVFGDEYSALKSRIYGLLSTVLMLIIILSLPEYIMTKIPNFIVPLIYTPIILGILERSQGKQINEHFEQGGQKASNWIAAAYGFVSSLLIVAVVLVFTLLQPIKGYEKSMDVNRNIVLHYSENTEDSTSQKVATFIDKYNVFDNSQEKDVFLTSEKEYYKLSLVYVDKELISDSLFIEELNRIKFLMNFKLALDKPIIISMMDADQENEEMLQEYDTPVSRFYKYIQQLHRYPINKHQTIYYHEAIPVRDVNILEQSVRRLISYFPPGKEIEFIFLNKDNDYVIKFIIPKESWNNFALIEQVRSFADYLHAGGIEKVIQVIFIDNNTFEESATILKV